jgi:hypothetical protein
MLHLLLLKLAACMDFFSYESGFFVSFAFLSSTARALRFDPSHRGGRVEGRRDWGGLIDLREVPQLAKRWRGPPFLAR